MVVFETIFLLLLLLLSVPVFVFAIQIAIALPAERRKPASSGYRPSIAVLVPAHNEAAGIAATLFAIQLQLQFGDRVLVVADNCTDDTAVAALAAGADVIARCDPERRGKGYALDFGVRHLALAPPAVVIIIDADCLLQHGALDLLACRSLAANRPMQALYMMQSPAGASLKTKVAEFAWSVKNWARALGFQRLGLPCQLMGTGMAFPWPLIEQAELASGHIVEDLKLGLDFARLGQAPLFCSEAQVTSVFPVNAEGVQSQRTRWEHGHLGMMIKEGPRLLLESLRTKNLDLFALTIDMCVPPLALLTLLVLVFCLLGMMLWAVTGNALPWSLAIINPAILSLAVLLVWARFGRAILTFGNLAYAPIYALRKIPLYLKFLVHRQIEWVRSHRDEP
ncbi:MAG: glycosyltransferase family 2 protein [Oxalobacteraceae bacterium]|nr:glycosyltransferase family 2 protein [Oxalobacteraceae bacterium]